MTQVQPEHRRVQGHVKWFDPAKGFGFIVAQDGGPDILLHANALRNCLPRNICAEKQAQREQQQRKEQEQEAANDLEGECMRTLSLITCTSRKRQEDVH